MIITSQYAGLSLRHNLSAKNGLINVRFMVLPRLAEYLGSFVLSEQGKSPLFPIFELAAIQNSASKIRGKGPLGNTADHPMLRQTLANTFRELDHLSPADLEKLADIDELRAQIVNWYHETRNLTAIYYTREELFRAATVVLEQEKAGSVLRDLGFIIFYLVFELLFNLSGLVFIFHMNLNNYLL